MAGASDTAIWCIRAGWSAVLPAVDTTIAVACALSSSNGNPGAPGGLFGIGNTGDGQTQANAAYQAVKARGWDALPAHRNNSYLIYMAAASVAVTTAGAVQAYRDPGGTINALTDAAGNLAGDTVLDQAKTGIALLIKAGAWLGDPNNWARILLVVLGGGMVIGGVTLAVGSSAAGPVAGAAVKVAKKVV